MIDTHAHLDAIDDDPADIVARARAAGVTRILTVGTTPAGCRRALELADTHEEVCAILGIHPHEAGRASHADIAEVCALLAHPKAVDLRLAATQVPADRILAETDAPYLAPQPVRGRRNEPAYVQHTLSALARARGVETADLEARIELNARECFGVATGSPVCGRGPSAVVRRPGVPP